MDRDHARDRVDVPRRAISAAPLLDTRIKRRPRGELLAHHLLDMRVTVQHRAVAAEHRYRSTLLQGDRSIKVLKITNVDRTEYEPEQTAAGAVNTTREKERPGAGDPADSRSADEHVGSIML